MNHDLLITNTCFRHKEKRLITWEQTCIVQCKLQKLKKTVDYICILYKYKHILGNSCLYHGTTTVSNHKLLVTKMKTRWSKQKNKKNWKHNTQLLINDKKFQEQYKNEIQDRINNNQDINWRETKSIICDTATEVLGFQRKNCKGQTIENNPIIEQLSRIQKEFRIKIENSSNIEEVKVV